MSLAVIFHFLCAQHVSDINISIIRIFSIMATYFIQSAIRRPEYFNNNLYIAINIVTLTNRRL